MKHCESLFEYKRRNSIEVNIGGVPLGGDQPIRVQSMTTADTMDTQASVEECLRLIDAGCEYIRLTAPSVKEAHNLEVIKKEIRDKGFDTPLVADIHFTPNAAEVAARVVEKVRINPGNFVDKKKFEILEYTDEEYNEEVTKIREKLIPLINICKEHGTSMRIGTNHGSLSDRIINRYGDNPAGMVESALEFLRVCEEQNYYDIVLSMKSSNPQVMVQAYRLLVQKMAEEGLKSYPLHLGVTEAGDGEDGRIKSAIGIGALLEDGIGDTIRVSLTEPAENEVPVAKKLVDRYADRQQAGKVLFSVESDSYSPFDYKKREVRSYEGLNLESAVIADFSNKELSKESIKEVGYHYLSATDKWSITDTAADYIYLGSNIPDWELPLSVNLIVDQSVAEQASELAQNCFVLTSVEEYTSNDSLTFVSVKASQIQALEKLSNDDKVVLVLESDHDHALAAKRNFFFALDKLGLSFPVILKRDAVETDIEDLQLYASTDLGGCFIDGYGNGVWLSSSSFSNKQLNDLSFGILQASRLRMVKTEYISCPSCGRTLFDLQETTAMIRSRTDHLKGVKIGIMGCIVNGPGEMADADYGYVGSGKGKITLYKGQEVVKRNIQSEQAVDELIELIKEHGDWRDPA